jgi:hypothetical protein
MNSENNTKLAATALLSAGLGALLTYHLSQRRRPSQSQPINTRASFIFHDPGSEPTHSPDAAVLFPYSHEERMRRRIAARMTIEEENSQPRQSVTVRVPGEQFFLSIYLIDGLCTGSAHQTVMT